MPKAIFGDISMYYEIHGEGEPLVMIPGGGAGVQSMLSRVRAFTPEYRVVVFDGRGTGQSDASDIPYTMEAFADEMSGLLDTIGIESAHIYGESFGGAVAQYFAIRHLGMVRSLVLVSTCCRGTSASDEPRKFLVGEVERTEERARTLAKLCLGRDFGDKHPDVVQRMTEGLMRQPLLTPVSVLRQQAFLVSDTCGRLQEIVAPTLVVHGEADQVIPVEHGLFLSSRIPGAELATFRNAGHFFIEAPAERDKAVLDFLRRHRQQEREP